jgi:DNA mismatch repair protein MutS2
MNAMIEKLDLTAYFKSFESYYARNKPVYMEGDQNRHLEMIQALDAVEFTPPKATQELHQAINFLRKQGVITLDVIFEFVKIIRYFSYLKTLAFAPKLFDFIADVQVPPELQEIIDFFHEDGTINDSHDEELSSINRFLEKTYKNISSTIQQHMQNESLQEFLVDRQVHLHQGQETLLLKAGFNRVLQGTIIGRSPAGYFYTQPDSVAKIKKQSEHYIQEKEALLYNYSKHFSQLMLTWLRFLEFIDKRFDVFDHYQARVQFSRSKNYEFIGAKKNVPLILDTFCHPALSNPKPISIDASKSVVMVTGVNAGGKTMLLKSVLTAVYLAKYLLPMKINAHASSIANFKEIAAVIDDPQNVNNDISTFAGRMQEFSKMLAFKGALIGVDEIELGTDSDEAASLFKVILEELIAKGSTIIVTTHHKRLAALMADRDDVALIAALYDEVNRKPTYEFLQGSIGKSYAFETALRYGIHNTLVKRAINEYGEDQEKLSELIEKSSELERSLKAKHASIDEKLAHIAKLENIIEDERSSLHREVQGTKGELSRAYSKAIGEAKLAAKAHKLKSTHQHMNKAHESLPEHETKPITKEEPLAVKDRVKYLTNIGVIDSIDGKVAMVEFESGMRMRVKLHELTRSNVPKAKPKKVSVSKPKAKSAGLKLDLHGLRSDEAIEKLDQFLSDALLQGWDEVLVYHGIGTGKLAFAVKNYLKEHPSVRSFDDAPHHMGGYGAKVISL